MKNIDSKSSIASMTLLGVLLATSISTHAGKGPKPKPGNNGVPGQIAELEQRILDLEDELSANKAPDRTGVNESIIQGDDGDWQLGREWPEPRFSLNVMELNDTNENGVCDGVEICDGTVTDNLTELVWLQDANCFAKQYWNDAINLSNNLSGDGTCGLDDGSDAGNWRMANIKELLSLLDYSQTIPAPLLPNGNPFLNVVGFEPEGFPANYWTSTAIAGDFGGYAFTLSLGVGWVERWTRQGIEYYFWPVRDMQ